MPVKKILIIIVVAFAAAHTISCKKDKFKERPPYENAGITRKILYTVRGTHFKLNYIDSNSVFQKDEEFHDYFSYEFRKGAGASIGLSIFRFAPVDEIYSWSIYIDDKLYANAFSEGGAYLTVPYH